MGIPNRIYNLAKAQLDRAVERWEAIDSKAQQEIDAFLASHTDTNNVSAWDRALNKINSSQAAGELAPASSRVDESALPEPSLDELEAKIAADRARTGSTPTTSPAASTPQTAQAHTQTLLAAYKMLGVEPGADYMTVQNAYRKLRERAAPERFADGSAERDAARNIQRRIDAAYVMISNVLAPSTDRFDRLEI